ncbi:MAG: AMP-binding protein [Desulfobacterales bacterium]
MTVSRFDIRETTMGDILDINANVEVKIFDHTRGGQAPAGVQGELCTRGCHVMKGYYKDKEATRLAIDRDGWLHTGDLAVMDQNGYVKITGRLKDMIIRSGENIYPREIEEFLYTHSKIKDVQVIGVPSEKYGEEVAAFIQVKPGQNLAAEELRSFCQGQIGYHKIPAFWIFVTEYPTTASGKIQKYKLREDATRRLECEAAARIQTA